MGGAELPERSPVPPEPGRLPRCPVCGEETDAFYRDRRGEIAGCDGCLRYVDPWECPGKWGNEGGRGSLGMRKERTD